MLEKQKQKIMEILSKNTKYNNIIFIGHHPIITEKVKKGIQYTYSLIELFKSLVDKLSQYQQKYYLCADTHNYQKTKIEMNELIIEQYITGTGGAEQDECVNPKIHNFSESKDYSDDIKENLKGIIFNINECRKEFGFLLCEEKDGQLEFKFIPSIGLNGGYYDKYIKYKTKYLKLKNKN